MSTQPTPTPSLAAEEFVRLPASYARRIEAEAEAFRRWQSLADRAVEWHRRRYPDARSEHVALKLCEEAGEVGRAVMDTLFADQRNRAHVAEEAADTLAALFVLMGRYFPTIDLLAAWEAKLSRLEASR